MLDLVAASARVLGPLRTVSDEEVALADAAGRVLSADVRSEIALPPWDNAAMDGYAVRGGDVAAASLTSPVTLRVAGAVSAGQRASQHVREGEAVRIMTGAPLPPGADSVIRVEDTDAGTAHVRITSARDVGRNIRPAGEDIAAGELAAERGSLLGPGFLALLAGVGCARPRVARRPVVAVIGSGDELTDVARFDEVRAGTRIVATNGYVLAALIREVGGEVLDMGVAPDDRARIRALISEGAARSDLVVTTAGVSVGDHDHTKAIVEELGRIDFWRISARPGSQMAFGSIGETPWLGLPGNPVSAAITGELFVRPAVLRLQGANAPHRAPINVRLGATLRGAPATTLLLRCRLVPRAGGFVAELTGPQGSGLMSSMAKADALLVIPAGAGELVAGATVQALPLHGAVAMTSALDVACTARA